MDRKQWLEAVRELLPNSDQGGGVRLEYGDVQVNVAGPPTLAERLDAALAEMERECEARGIRLDYQYLYALTYRSYGKAD